MDAYSEARRNKSWHHDIKKIDGRWVEEVVDEYQRTDDGPTKDAILDKIMNNYAIFRGTWARGYAHFLDGDIEAGKIMHDEVVWISANKFDRERVKKENGYAFNAYLVSGQLNTMKNMRNKRMSHKNHPRIKCPVCEEKVYQIDEKHLRHDMTIERYQKMFYKYPISCVDGLMIPPWGGEPVPEITESMLNRTKQYLAVINAEASSGRTGRYTSADFAAEFPSLANRTGAICPLTKQKISNISASYPSSLMSGYTESEFIRDFPDFEGIITCPFSGKKKLEITQEYLDEVLDQSPSNQRATIAEFRRRYKYFTTKPRQVPVINPYAKTRVPEITHEMLLEAGTTVREHLGRFATIIIGKRYNRPVHCPFTGKPFYCITNEHLDRIGRTVHEFYQATCEYPLRRWQVRSAIDGAWCDNVWGHLAKSGSSYAPKMLMEEFERTYGRNTKAFVSTNSYTENDSGESMHVADLVLLKKDDATGLEVEDSLMSVAQDALDRRIVEAIRGAHTLEDIIHAAAETSKVALGKPFKHGAPRRVRDAVRGRIGSTDFDIVATPAPGATEVDVMTPSRDTIKKRLMRMVSASDLVSR